MTTSEPKVSFTLAKTDDGNVQIVFTIPIDVVKKAKEEALTEIGQNTEIPGFRKGKAPLTAIADKVDPQTLVEKVLAKTLPDSLNEAINKNNIKIAIYPKFEAVKISDDEPWEIKALTCEIPEISLGDYKKTIIGELKTKSIWTPDKAKSDLVKEQSRDEKEQSVIKAILENIKVKVPLMLITEEVNIRLSELLSRLEKLGLTLESYLRSLGKTPVSLRSEYQTQAQNTLALELILEKIAQDEKIKIDEKQIDEAINASAAADTTLAKSLDTPERRRLIASVLRRRSSLDLLVSLI